MGNLRHGPLEFRSDRNRLRLSAGGYLHLPPHAPLTREKTLNHIALPLIRAQQPGGKLHSSTLQPPCAHWAVGVTALQDGFAGQGPP